mmetsp:Transcript_16639/g.14542  ORF Transcript_16639/g.14542 Transcript_16639/m.14542 type:complete len:84 (+) Transcript_16639:841-1092(+)
MKPYFKLSALNRNKVKISSKNFKTKIQKVRPQTGENRSSRQFYTSGNSLNNSGYGLLNNEPIVNHQKNLIKTFFKKSGGGQRY